MHLEDTLRRFRHKKLRGFALVNLTAIKLEDDTMDQHLLSEIQAAGIQSSQHQRLIEAQTQRRGVEEELSHANKNTREMSMPQQHAAAGKATRPKVLFSKMSHEVRNAAPNASIGDSEMLEGGDKIPGRFEKVSG